MRRNRSHHSHRNLHRRRQNKDKNRPTHLHNMRRQRRIPRMTQRLYRPREVAAMFGLSQDRFYFVSTKCGYILPTVRTHGGHSRYTDDDIEAFKLSPYYKERTAG